MKSSDMFKLDTNDVVRGVITAVIAGIVVSLAGVVQTPGFDVFTANWGMILGSAINAAFAAFIGYVGKNFLSDSKGAFLGSVGAHTK